MTRTLSTRSAVSFVAAVLGVIAIWQVGLPLWRARPSAPPAPVPVATAPAFIRDSAQPLAGVARPLARLPGSDTSVSAERRPLLLVSTHPGRDPQHGTVQLGVDGNYPQTYVAGALLENGTRITEVYTDRVVLTRGEERTVLYVPSARHAGPDGDSALATVGGHVETAPASAVGPARTLTGPDLLRATPVSDGGRLVGLRIVPGPVDGPFRRWGLVAGDVVTAVNGTPIALAEPSSVWLQRVIDGEPVTVTLVRGSRSLTVILHGSVARDLAAGADL